MNHHLLKSNFSLYFSTTEKTLNLAERNRKRCVEIEKKIRAAGNDCMDQSYFKFLFQLLRKSKQSGFSKSEKSLGTRIATYM